MTKYKVQHSRLLFIDRKLREGKFPNCTSLAEEWEVSTRTISRDLEYMRDLLDAPIAYSPKNRGFHYTEKNFQLPAMSISEGDLFGVYLAEKLLVQYKGSPMYKSLCSVFEKITQSLPEKTVGCPADEPAKFTVFPPFVTAIEPDIWETIVSCLRNFEQVEMRYKTPGQEPISRKFDPYHAVSFEGNWYIIGYCHLRDEIRTFSMARIRATKKTGTKFQVPQDFDFQKISGSHFGIYFGNEDIAVKIRFKKEIAEYIKERVWHPSQKIEDCNNGDILLSLTINHLHDLQRWVLSWGEYAQVLEPESLLSDIRHSLNSSQRIYQ
jgi:predicted DNA-binding transcriptional regulator YafY